MQTLTRTPFIDRTRAQTLREVLHAWTDSHSLTIYDDLVPALRQAGVTTCLVPYTSSPRAKKLELQLAICPFIDFEGSNETKYEAHPTHFYTMLPLRPMTEYMQDLWIFRAKEPWYSVDLTTFSFGFLLSKPQKHSSKSGRGFSHRENLEFFDQQFNADWDNSPDKIIEPAHEFDDRRMRFRPTAYNPDWK